MNDTRREFAVRFGSGFVSLSTLRACRQDSPPANMARKEFEPAYRKLGREELERRVRAFKEIYKSCRLCPRACGANRAGWATGVCRSTSRAKVYSAHPHFGEERPLVGRGGSGTIFFSNCNLQCVFCQNWEINHRGDGTYVSDERIAAMMLELERRGCRNINVVTPTHVAPNIVAAVAIAARQGLRAPIVYNCGGYESLEVVKLLEGIVDIYLPDFKYADGDMAAKYSAGARDYPEAAAAAIKEMHRQVGELVVDEDGVALRGLMIRHLVMPGNIAGSDRFVRWVAAELTTSTYVNIMGQYRPEYKASQFPDIARRVTGDEHRQAIRWAREAGLTRLDGAI
ncbi:MAG: radical SAM protein [Bryobacteraceae bacterium]|nr:radical SAM protein [Bryobacteraceae bacterium]